jgi:SSS family solute:Na+ symporter
MFAVSWTNVLDVVLILVGIITSAGVAISYTGGLPTLGGALPKEMFSISNVGWNQICVWLVANVTAIIATQYIIQALASSKGAKTAKQSSILAGILLIPIALCAAVVGMSAAVAAPDIHPAEAYGWFAIHTNPFLGGLMVVGLGAAMMGSLSAATHGATALVLRDFYVGIYRPDATEKERLRFARWANGIFAIVPMFLALFTPTLLSILFFGRGLRGTLGVIVLCALFAPKLLGARLVSISIVSALVISSAWYLLGNPFGINNVFIAVGIPVIFAVFSVIRKREASRTLLRRE